MPLTTEQKRSFLASKGFDPDSHDLQPTPDGAGYSVVPISNAMPTATGVGPTQQAFTTAQTSSTLGAAGRSALNAAPSAIGGGLGAALLPLGIGAALTATGVGALEGVPLMLTGIAGAIGGSALGSAAKNVAVNALPQGQAINQQLALDQQQHPYATTAGALATIPLGGLSPSPRNLITAGRTIGKMATGIGASAPEIGNLANIGVGAGIAGGQAAVEPLFHGQTPEVGDVLKSAALGALFNSPNAIGRGVYGFHGATPEAIADAARIQPEMPYTSRQTTATTLNGPDYNESSARQSLMKDRYGNNVDTGKTDMMYAMQQRLQAEKDVLAAEQMRTAHLQTTATRIDSTQLRLQNDALEQQLSEQQRYASATTPTTAIPITSEAAPKVKVPIDTTLAYTPSDQATMQQYNESQGTGTTAYQSEEQPTLLEGTPADRTTTARKLKASDIGQPSPLTTANDVPIVFPNNDKTAKPTGDRAGGTAPVKPDVINYVKELAARLGLKHNVDVQFSNGQLVSADGKPVNGSLYVGDILKQAVAKFGTGAVAKDWNTVPHEFIHDLFQQLSNSSKAGDKALHDKLISLADTAKPADGALGYRDWLQNVIDTKGADTTVDDVVSGKFKLFGDTHPAEEYWAQHTGELFKHIAENPQGESFGKSLMSALKVKYGNPTTEDVGRLLTNKLHGGEDYAQRFPTIGKGVSTTPTTDNQDSNQSKVKPKNLKSLIDTEWDEGHPNDGGDGYWIQLKDGWEVDGSTAIHEETKQKAYDRLHDVKHVSNQDSEQPKVRKELPVKAPAIRTFDGKVIEGQQGDTHADIVGRAIKARELKDLDFTRGFVDKDGKWLTREEASALLNEPKPLQSERLNELQGGKTSYQDAQQPSTQTDTPEFKKWFGDSKVKDENGKPLVVYHGTSKDTDFKSFNTKQNGIWFSKDPEAASAYASQNDSQRSDYTPSQGFVEKNTASRVIPAYVKMENPLVIPVDSQAYKNWQMSEDYRGAARNLVNMARQGGHDGILLGNHNVIAINPEQIKSSIGNRGTFDSTKKRIDYQDKDQPKTLGLTRPLVDTVAKITDDGRSKSIADAAIEARNTKQEYMGRFHNPVMDAMEKATPADRAKVLKLLNQEVDDKSSYAGSVSNNAQRNLYNSIRESLGAIRDQQIENKQPVLTASGVAREAGKDPYYMPQSPDKATLDAIRENTDLAKVGTIKDKFMEYWKSKDAELTDEDAKDLWDRFSGAIRGDLSNVGSQIHSNSFFNAIRRTEGLGVPPDLREGDLRKVMARYNNRATSDMSWYKHVEGNPDVGPLVGYSKDLWRMPYTTPVDQSLAGHQDVKNLVGHLRGESADFSEQGIKKLEAASTVSLLGPLTEIHKAISIVTQAVTASHPADVVKHITSALTSLSDGYKNALDYGSNIKSGRTLADNARTLIDGSVSAVEKLSAGTALLRASYTLNGMTDRFNSAFTNAYGESWASSAVARAKAGDNHQLALLKRLDPSINLEEPNVPKLASLFAEQLHGAKDVRNMPNWMLNDNEIGAFMKLMHWQVGATNNFMTNVWTPATRGNVVPLLTSALGTVLGGYVIKQLRETVSDRKGPIPTLTDLINSDINKKQGFEGRSLEDNKSLIAYHGLELASMAGFGGLISMMAKSVMDMAYKNKPQGAIFPLDELASSTAVIGDRVLAALHQGDSDVLDVLKRASIDWMKTNVQMARIAVRQLGDSLPDEKQRHEYSEALGELRRFKMASGLPYEDQSSFGNENPYLDLSAQSLKREKDPSKIAEELPQVVHHLMGAYGSQPTVLLNKLEALKKANYETMPSIDNDPLGFGSYYNYKKLSDGEKNATGTLIDYLKTKALNQAKSSAIP